MTTGGALFETALGLCGIAWNGQGIVAVQLPEATREETARRLLVTTGASLAPPPAWVEALIARLVRHLAGEPQALDDVPLALEKQPAFWRRVYEAARHVPPGQTVTYGELARRVGSPGAARAVGQAMAHNPFLLLVPCHRVVASGGRPGGFSAAGGLDVKRRLLFLEGAAIPRVLL